MVSTITVLLLLGIADADPAVKLVTVKKIWDRAPHNAFTDLIRHEGHWYCTFREGTGHAAGAGVIRVLVSVDGNQWESAASLELPGIDLRDPKLSRTPDGRLMLLGGAAVPASRDPLTDHYSFVSFSKDAKDQIQKNWTAPEKVAESWQWLWRVAWHNGTAYGVAYQWDPKQQRKGRSYSAILYHSGDGRGFGKVVEFDLPNATEAALAFDGDEMLCLQRRDGSPNNAMLGRSKPPYREWTWKDLGVSLGGPMLIRGPASSWWASGRLTVDKKPQTVLCRLDVANGALKPVLTLPSGGDTSYAGMVWHEGELWISYYSSHEGKSAIYLARVRLVQR